MQKAAGRYYQAVQDLLEEINRCEMGNIEKGAEVMAEALATGHGVFVIGPGLHSYMAAEEMFYRAGGLVPIRPILEPSFSGSFGALRCTRLERTPGIAPRILQEYGLGPGDVLIIHNTYGINAASIDSALEARRLGAVTVGITSRAYSQAAPSDHPARHPSRRNLYELVDILIDSHVPPGDGVVSFREFPQKVGPVSTLAMAYILNLLVVLTVEKLLERGVHPEIWQSGNTEGGDEFNRKFLEKYRGKIRHL